MVDTLVPSRQPLVQGLLLACVQDCLHTGAADLGGLLRNPGIDWHGTHLEAKQHGVLPLLRQSLKGAPAELVPRAVLRLLDRDFRYIAGRNLALSCELTRLVDVLWQHGIRVLPWKGPVLGAALYGSPCLREFLDLDFVIARRDAPRAVELLTSCGYALQGPLGSTLSLADSERHRSVSLTRPNVPAVTELHWDIGPRWGLPQSRSELSLDFEALWKRRESVALCGCAVPHLGAEQLLLSLCVHGAWHYWSRLFWICDIATVIRTRNIDWHSLFYSACRLRCHRRLCLALRLASDLLGVEIPQPARTGVDSVHPLPQTANWVKNGLFREEPLADQTARDGNSTPDWVAELEDVAFAASVRDCYRDRLPLWLGFVRAHLKPTASDRQVLALPACLSRAYYLLRPARLLWDYGLPTAWRLSKALFLGARRRDLTRMTTVCRRLGRSTRGVMAASARRTC